MEKIAKLKQHARSFDSLTLAELFAENEERVSQFCVELDEMTFDFSKNHLSQETLTLLVEFAKERHLSQAIEALFQGHPLNATENRSALHTALRRPLDMPLILNGHNIMQDIAAELDRMEAFVKHLHRGYKANGQDVITDVVNLGIGGSDLGPQLAVEALKPFHQNKIKLHFVSNIDGTHLMDTLGPLDPKRTLFLVSSKSFTTIETLQNANTAKAWLAQHDCTFEQHFFAMTACEQKALDYGISQKAIFRLWDWVGGRYSLWSVIGLPIAIAIGMEHFKTMLEGAYAMDCHYQSAPFHQNIPVIMALISLWYINCLDAHTQAILPYSQHLALLPSYIQQLDMESNGKSVDRDSRPLNHKTAPIVWGQAGCNGQHAFHQLLHQGAHLIPIDFILFAKAHHALDNHHHLLLANALSQAHALMMGYKEGDVHQHLPGNRPSNILLFDKLTPSTFGKLIALYEHKIYTQSVLWNINAFDQFGIERGKVIAHRVLHSFTQDVNPMLDPSTDRLISKIKQVIS